MLEKIFDWLASDNFVWFIIGWSSATFLLEPGIGTFLMLLFWVWVLNREEM